MKKNVFFMFGLLLIAISVAGCAQPPADLAKADTQTTTDDSPAPTTGTWQPINKETSNFSFEGYGPGKAHLGTFTDYEGELLMQNGDIIGAKGVIAAASASTGIDGLDKHLKSEDFFNTEVYPDIVFTSTSITDNTMTGELTFIGVTNTISFPITKEGAAIAADFLLDTTPYGLKYLGMNKEVRIAFTMTN